MKRFAFGVGLIVGSVVGLCFGVPERAEAQKTYNYWDATRYPNGTPNAGGIMAWADAGVPKTTTFSGMFAAGLDITANPLRIVGAGKNTIFASLAATSDKTMTFPNVTCNVVSTGDSATVTNAMLAGSIAATKLVGTDIATVGTITSGAWNGTAVPVANGGTGATTAANARANLGIVNDVQPTRLTADVTESAAALTNLTDLSQTLTTGTKYTGRLAVKCVNSTATDGLQFDFNGGTATFSSFWAGAGILASGGTDVIGANISTSLAGAITFTTFTGESVIVFEISGVCNGNGTFIPRAAENAHTTGTAIFRLGSFLKMEPSAN